MSGVESESGEAVAGTGSVITKLFSDLTAHELHDILELRNIVFVVEQNCVYNDIDGRDVEPGTRHVWTEHDGKITSYLRVLCDGHDVSRIGRVVTHPESRGQGLAMQLLKSVISDVQGAIVLDAQAPLEAWYETFGFSRSGDGFLEDGIAHVPMRRERT